MKILLIGNGAREHAIAYKLKENKEVELFVFASANNPGILKLATEIKIGDLEDVPAILDYAKKIKPNYAWIGPEAPLAAGVVDELAKINIPAVGPVKELAKLETSKSFTRDLLVKNNILAYPKYKTFVSEEGLEEFCSSLEKFVVKPDGLTGGKGVKVQDDHFQSANEGINYAKECLQKDGKVIIEEKLIGQEFSLMSFADGKHLAHMPAVQDHKRALVGDKGPNTGGMGSYSCANSSMPFLKVGDIEEAQKINQQVLEALGDYRGVLYGNFITTKNGLKIIEYNARLGDPEAMNVLLVLKTDLAQIGQAIVDGALDKLNVEFENKATVCKYVVPEGYPEKPVKNQAIDVSKVDQNKVKLFYASVDLKDNQIILKGSRAIGVIAKADTLEEAEKIVEQEIIKIKGPVFHREDIGTNALIDKRVKMMEEIRNG
ncbi:MAG: phosphoribosylamine--glycine ligase [Patescibacteria group bacterium]|jgi:phosphoribosylamine--glycine ligase